MTNKIFRIIFSLICIFGTLCFTACGETPPENAGYLKSEQVVVYNNTDVTFEFVLNDYELTVSGETLTKNDYKIQNGVLTVYADYFERENKKEYTFTYSLRYLDDQVTGNLTVNAAKWSDITWHD